MKGVLKSTRIEMRKKKGGNFKSYTFGFLYKARKISKILKKHHKMKNIIIYIVSLKKCTFLVPLFKIFFQKFNI